MRDLAPGSGRRISDRDLHELACATQRCLQADFPSTQADRIDDAVCEAVVQFLENAPPDIEEPQVRAWLMTASDRNLSHRRRGERSLAEIEEIPPLEENEARLHRMVLVRQILEQCRENLITDRTFRSLKMWREGYNSEEIAAQVGITSASARQKIHRALEAAREWLRLDRRDRT